MLKKIIISAAGVYAPLHLARTIIRRKRDFDWLGKRVVVTGGSRGLGLIIARQLADQGAILAICARSADELGSLSSCWHRISDWMVKTRQRIGSLSRP